MYWILAGTFSNYMNFYQQFLVRWWKTMTPMEFVGLQIGIAAAGWLLMKNIGR